MIEGAAQTERLSYLDGWRGLAILSVLIGHFFGVFPMGAYGVELFFVLSGRLMADILFVKRMPLGKFFRRRFSRIYPALLFLVLALGALTLAGRAVGAVDEGVSLVAAVTSLVFFANYAEVLGWTDGGLLGHVWSLAVEEHCYALLAFLALTLARNQQKAMIICLGLASLAMANGVRLYLDGAGGVHEIYWRTDVRLAPVFLSAGLYLLIRKMKSPPGSLAAACVLVSLPIYLLVDPLPLKYIVPTILLAFAVNTIDFAPKAVLGLLSWRPLVGVGMISYSLYLWQQPFFVVTRGSSLAIAPVFVAALLSYWVVEKPVRLWLNERWGRTRPAPQPHEDLRCGEPAADPPAVSSSQ